MLILIDATGRQHIAGDHNHVSPLRILVVPNYWERYYHLDGTEIITHTVVDTVLCLYEGRWSISEINPEEAVYSKLTLNQTEAPAWYI